MTTPGGPGQPGGAGQPGQGGWPAAPWQGGDVGFGVPQPPPQYQPPPPYGAQQAQHVRPAPGQGGGSGTGQVHGSRIPAHGRPQEGRAGGSGPHWGRIAVVVAGVVVVVAAGVFAVMWFLGGSGGEAVGATEEFFEAVKAGDTQAAVAATCRQAPTLPEQMGKGIKRIEASMGTFDKVVVSAPSTTTSGAPNQDPSAQREAADFELRFSNGSVGGHAMLVREDERWKVCFVDLEPPRANTP